MKGCDRAEARVSAGELSPARAGLFDLEARWDRLLVTRAGNDVLFQRSRSGARHYWIAASAEKSST